MTCHREAGISEVDIKMSDIYLNMAASDIHLCLDIWQIIQADLGKHVKTDTIPVTEGPHYDLWNTKILCSEDWIKPAGTNNNSEII
jgi:hypothetical protein